MLSKGVTEARLGWVNLVAHLAHTSPGWGCILIASSSGACLETKELMRNWRGLVNSGVAGEALRTAGNRMVQQEWLDPSQSMTQVKPLTISVTLVMSL